MGAWADSEAGLSHIQEKQGRGDTQGEDGGSLVSMIIRRNVAWIRLRIGHGRATASSCWRA